MNVVTTSAFLFSFGALILGGLIGWGFAKARWATALEMSKAELTSQIHSIAQEKAQLLERASQIPELQNRLLEAERARQEINARRDELQVSLSSASVQIAELKTKLEAEHRQFGEKIVLLEQAKEIMSNQFKALADEILEAKATRFTEHNRTQIDHILQPLKLQLKDFREKVEDIHHKDVQQQATLRAELGQLKELNRQITEEAHGLATALRGQAKMQGNWGELVLENVLERSGLRSDKDYKREVNFTTESGRQRPDVVVYLPQGKHLIIDAKVSLNAYTRYVNSESEGERSQALKEHVLAVASRIKELANRTYFELPGVNTPEVVFMFIPIESAFVEALRADESLFQKAIEQNVLVATPTTLLTSLNIVSQLWRFEEQNAHTAELADRAGKVYKKLNTFLQSMESIGTALDRAKTAYSNAFGQLYAGKDNLIKQANDFKRLGVSVQGSLPEHLVAKADLELEYFPDSDDDNPVDIPAA